MKIKKRKKNERKKFFDSIKLKKKNIFLCPNCNRNIAYSGGHFVAPSNGEDGYFICDKF